MSIDIQVTFDAHDPEKLAEFWALALDYQLQPPPPGFSTWQEFAAKLGYPEERWHDYGAAIDPDGAKPRLFFQKVPEGYIGFVEELPGAKTQGATLEARDIEVAAPGDAVSVGAGTIRRRPAQFRVAGSLRRLPRHSRGCVSTRRRPARSADPARWMNAPDRVPSRWSRSHAGACSRAFLLMNYGAAQPCVHLHR